MECRCSFGPACVLILFLLSPIACAQTASSPPTDTKPATQTAAAEQPNDVVPITYATLEIQNSGKLKLPESRVNRIFTETIREVARHLNPKRPPTVLAKVVLRIGEPGYNVETVVNAERNTVIRMQTWNEYQFARMVARAARHGLFTDVELDAAAEAALKHVNAVTSVKELSGAQ